MIIQLKRVYLPPSPSDGRRILVERLWPRGLLKAAAALDDWVRDLAPSPALRTWYDHDPDKWPDFQTRYRAELDENSAALIAFATQWRGQALCFVYAAKDEQRNSALVLKGAVERLQTATGR